MQKIEDDVLLKELREEDLPPEVAAQFQVVAKDVEEMMERLRVDHGPVYVEAVSMMLNVRQAQMLLVVGGAPEDVLTVHSHLLATVVKITLRAMGLYDKLHVDAIDQHASAVIAKLGETSMAVPKNYKRQVH